ncbi:MAG: 2Fe-2S iron-sulfur cluster-binding protein [Solitalea-like symbiont of Acarus siro]
MADPKFKVTIDDHTIEVPPGTSILEAARLIGGGIVPPAMCYYSSLKDSGGKCRTCLVKVTKRSEKDPRPMPKLVISCKTMVMDGMEVQNTTSQEVLDARKGVVEMLLINHPLDCPICDQAGECKLQDLSYEHGSPKTRYDFERRTFEHVDLGDKIKLHMTRCILCYRCIHVANQLTPERLQGVLERGDKAEISTYIKENIDNEFSGNMIDVCPVGALTDKTFRFKQRVWFTDPQLAHRNCSKCCGKVLLWFKGESILRVTARRNDYNEVVEYICNECRFDNKDASKWVIEGPAHIKRSSVISANHYDIPTMPVLKQYHHRIEPVQE